MIHINLDKPKIVVGELVYAVTGCHSIFKRNHALGVDYAITDAKNMRVLNEDIEDILRGSLDAIHTEKEQKNR